MKWLLLTLSVVFVFVAVPAMGQAPSGNEIRIAETGTNAAPAQTSEIWFYQEQFRHYMDPKLSLRRIGEQKAAQRRARLDAQRWYGYSNARPAVGRDPVHGDWGSRWVSGNRYHPTRWGYFGPSMVVVRPTVETRTR